AVGVLFRVVGICRGSEAGAPIVAMTLKHYPGMAEAEIARHAEEAQQRWPLAGVTVVHRFGRLLPGEEIVLVSTASTAREPAFAAAEFLMDYLKTRAPFCKQIEYADRTAWVAAKESDDRSADRWSASPDRRDAAEEPPLLH